MTLIESLSAYLPAIDLRPISQIEQEIVDELEFHIAMRTEENMNQGMSPAAARAAALTQFGDFAAVHQKCRRALLGARIMSQRIQMALSLVLLAAVMLLAVQLFTSQRANQAAIDDIASALRQLAPASAGGAAQATNEKPANNAAATDPTKSYPIEIKAESVREFGSLDVDFGKLKLSGKAMTVVPISTEVGVTGAVLLGDGAYLYTPAAGVDFRGHFRAAMLRFNPKDANSIIKLYSGKSVADKGGAELAKAILGAVFRHCYHEGPKALIPPEGAIAADVFSQELGDVLFSSSENFDGAYNFTTREMLYEKKRDGAGK
jgi:hypothetical protein